MRTWWLLALVPLLAACGAGAPPAPTPVLVSITQGVETCGDVIRAAAQQPYCDEHDVCYVAATYNQAAPTENIVERGAIGSLDTLDNTALQLGELPNIPNAVRWESVAIYTTDATLITLGTAQLSGISPELNSLSLTAGDMATGCGDAPSSGLLVQSHRNEVVLIVNGARVTVSQTALLSAQDDKLTVYGVAGVTVVAADGVSRVIRDGEQSTLMLIDGSISAPLPATAADQTIRDTLPLAGLPEPVQSSPDGNTAQTETTCAVREDWLGTYTVQRGDTLVTIAPRYGLDATELQVGNCVVNPNRLQVGTVLRIPVDATATPAAPLLPTTGVELTLTAPSSTINSPTASPAPVTVFAVDNDNITPGMCTTLRWNPTNAVAVELDGEPVATNGERQVCPPVTTVYTLGVRYADGTGETINRAITINRR